MKYVLFALIAAILSAEDKLLKDGVPLEPPTLTDQEKAGLYYMLWQQEAAEARLAAAQMATKDACAAVPACAAAATAERKAETEADTHRKTVAAAFKPLQKEGWELTAQLTYRKKEAPPVQAKK